MLPCLSEVRTYLSQTFKVGDLIGYNYCGQILLGHVTEVGSSMLWMSFDYDKHGRPGLWHTSQTSYGIKREMEEGIMWIVCSSNKESQ